MKIINGVFILLFLPLIVTFSRVYVDARKSHIKNRKSHGYSHPPARDSLPDQRTTFGIMSFGANGNGIFDDSKALQAVWKAACKVSGATIEIPSGFKFLIKPTTLQGPCMPDLVLQVDGTLLAPPHASSWPKSSLFQWMNFKWVYNFTIKGSGIVDGQGTEWWSSSHAYSMQKIHSKHIPAMKPTALRFYSSINVTVRDIRIINSPQCHLKFDNSRGIEVDNITISSPEYSPNTDGIHLQNTKDVEIQYSNIACGDDCVSIQTGCSNIHIHNINCGPGHGVSLGGLGKDKSIACVSNIIVEKISMTSTLYGVRIKTWQGGIGIVRNVSFSRIHVSDVKVPIMIDQYYCDKYVCQNQTGTVAIEGVQFQQIIGTYAVQSIHLACSQDIPCTDVDLNDIQLTPSVNNGRFQQALCANSYGKSYGPLLPSTIDDCLRSAGGYIKRISRSHEIVCN